MRKFVNTLNRWTDPVAPFLFLAWMAYEIQCRRDLPAASGFFAAFCYACKVAT